MKGSHNFHKSSDRERRRKRKPAQRMKGESLWYSIVRRESSIGGLTPSIHATQHMNGDGSPPVPLGSACSAFWYRSSIKVW